MDLPNTVYICCLDLCINACTRCSKPFQSIWMIFVISSEWSSIRVFQTGWNHRIDPAWNLGTLPLLTGIKKQNFMIIGVNMSNPQSGNFGNGRFAPSVCSLVASADPDCTMWVHSFRVQPRGNELILDLENMLSDALQRRAQFLVSKMSGDVQIVMMFYWVWVVPHCSYHNHVMFYHIIISIEIQWVARSRHLSSWWSFRRSNGGRPDERNSGGQFCLHKGGSGGSRNHVIRGYSESPDSILGPWNCRQQSQSPPRDMGRRQWSSSVQIPQLLPSVSRWN